MADWLGRFDREQPVDLLVANAGISAGPDPDSPPKASRLRSRQIRVNLLGAINTIEPLLPALCARGRGRVAVVASIAAYRGLPYSPGYCASKAGLRAYAEALRPRLAPRGVGVTIVCPGFFDSPMTDRFNGPTPFLASGEAAARIVKRGIDRGRAPRRVSVAAGARSAILRHRAGDHRRRDLAALSLSHPVRAGRWMSELLQAAVGAGADAGGVADPAPHRRGPNGGVAGGACSTCSRVLLAAGLLLVATGRPILPGFVWWRSAPASRSPTGQSARRCASRLSSPTCPSCRMSLPIHSSTCRSRGPAWLSAGRWRRSLSGSLCSRWNRRCGRRIRCCSQFWLRSSAPSDGSISREPVLGAAAGALRRLDPSGEPFADAASAGSVRDPPGLRHYRACRTQRAPRAGTRRRRHRRW